MSSIVASGGQNSRDVQFFEAISLFFRNYVNFNGRSSRGAYWWVCLFNLLLGFVTAFIDLALFPAGELSPVNTAVSLVTLLPGLAVSVRRLHDVGRSGWWNLIAITIIGIIPLLYWYCKPGQRQANVFGEDVEEGR